MCLFTHFAVGALAGGLCGHPVAGVAAGIASHAVLDMIPHYDHPDWRLELLGGAGTLVLLLLLPFGSLAAVLGGLGGMLPDLENLFQKLGWYSRRRFIFPTHNGILPHGRRLARGSLSWQVALAAASFLLLGLVAAPSAEAAATEDTALLGRARITVLEEGADATVVRIRVPLVAAPGDWQAADPRKVRWTDPLTVDDQAGQDQRFSAPRRDFTLAVPTLDEPQVIIRSLRWYRQPDTPADPVTVSVPRVFRSVPLLGCRVDLGAGGGVLSEVVVEIHHPRQNRYQDLLVLGGKAAAKDFTGLVTPHGLLNEDLFRVLGLGARQEALAARAGKGRDGLRSGFDFGATAHWVRLDVRTNGPVRLTGAQLSGMGVPVTDIDPDKLRLYRGGGLALDPDPSLPDDQQADRIGLQEVAVEVLDGGDQEWNLDDELRFYAVASSAWRDRFPGAAERLDHYDHPFADHATYWLTWEDEGTPSPLPGSPLRMASDPANPGGGTPVTTARVRLHREKQLLDNGGLFLDNWAWDSFVISSRPDTFTLRHPVAGATARFVVDVRGNYYSYRDYQFSAEAWLNGDSSQKATLDFLSSEQSNPDSMRVRVVGNSTAVNDGLNTLTLANASQPSGSTPKQPIALDSFDISYLADLILDPGAEALETIFSAVEPGMPASPFDIRIRAPGAGSLSVWDVTDPLAPRILVAHRDAQDPDYWSLAYSLGDAADHQLVLVRDGAFGGDLQGQLAEPTSLRDGDTDLDYVVVYAPDFAFAATTLAAYRNTAIPGIAAPAAAAVSAEDIYDNFSGGQKDPRAIRNYLRWVYEQGGHRLQYACFIGNASRDYRNYLGHPVGQGLYDFLPTEIRTVFPDFPVSGSSSTPYASDDGLVSFDYLAPGILDYPDLACGRLPAGTVSDALDMVSRIISYDGNPEPGSWRNRLVFAADDANRPEHGQYGTTGEIYHTVQADVLTEQYLPRSLDVTKIYGVAYPFPSPTSNLKPQMANDIKAAMTEGTTIFHYIGHGAEDNLADEQVFQSRDIPGLLNGMKRFVFVAFSCDVGVFDSPNRLSMAEEFLSAPAGGAIACITASQVSYSSSNDKISNAFYADLYPDGHVAADQTIGLALMEAKGLMVWNPDIENSQHFNIMGDPALSLPNPPDVLEFAAGSVDTLFTAAKQAVILATDGQDPPQPGDSYDVRVEDSGFDQGYVVYTYTRNPNPPPLYIYTPTERYYHHKGASVFRGTGIATGAGLEIPFMNPAQFRYGDDARIRVIVTGGGTERAGVVRLSSERGNGQSGNDVEGPRIEMAFADGRYRVRTGSLLTAQLADSSGIAILGTSPGNSLLLEFDDTGFMTDVTGSFTFDQNSYTAGRLSFPLPADLDLGSHRAALHASDALGNVGSDTLSFQLIPAGVRGLENVTLFPNPTPGPCRLLFDLSDPMTVQWEIYTLAGRRIKTTRQDFASAGPVIMAWDGRDDRGDEIANGTYLFVLRGLAASADEREITKTGKLVVMR